MHPSDSKLPNDKQRYERHTHHDHVGESQVPVVESLAWLFCSAGRRACELTGSLRSVSLISGREKGGQLNETRMTRVG